MKQFIFVNVVYIRKNINFLMNELCIYVTGDRI